MLGPQNWNLAREVSQSSGLNSLSPGYNVQRACGTSLETAWQLAEKISLGQIESGIAAGVDTNSDIAISVSNSWARKLLQINSARTFMDKLKIILSFRPSDFSLRYPAVMEPRTKMSMGEHTELMVKEWKISREAQDELALASHLNAAKAYDAGFFDDLVVPFMNLKKDGTVRGDTSLDKLAKLKPAFDPVNGSLTAGNSSPLTDGSACVLVGNAEGAQKVNAKILAEIIDVQVAAVDFVHGAGLLMAPTKAVAQLLTRNNLSFGDFDYFEIHEAFAGQVLSNLKAWETADYCRNVLGLQSALGVIDRKRLNVVGSSLSVGHPFAATGARILGTLAKLLSQSTGKKRGLISICTAGGMGIAAILETP